MSFKPVFTFFLLLKFWGSGFCWRTLYMNLFVVYMMYVQTESKTSKLCILTPNPRPPCPSASCSWTSWTPGSWSGRWPLPALASPWGRGRGCGCTSRGGSEMDGGGGGREARVHILKARSKVAGHHALTTVQLFVIMCVIIVNADWFGR